MKVVEDFLKKNASSDKLYNRLRNVKSCKKIKLVKGFGLRDDSKIKTLRKKLNEQSKRDGRHCFLLLEFSWLCSKAFALMLLFIPHSLSLWVWWIRN